MRSNRCPLCLFVLSTLVLAMLAAAGCGPRDRTDTRTLAQAPAPPEERVVVVERSPESPRRYFRDTSGQLYYADPQGGLHIIQRTERVETGTGGLYYVVDDNPIQYYMDDSGRMYYYGSGRSVVYLEESGPGHVIDPLPILRGSSVSNRLETGRSMVYCDSQWKKCMQKCSEAPGLENKKNCQENCDYDKEQCLRP
ncbi:hypothetical protein [Fundidesulfovibrio terrae]|uniref:hypothetical protein n=1 Tax=Fundidesulfovibrio terrae TaxID=2922866 RepID=UPI001FAE946D|nr:hypothetical protein [Fundidesulfovibrio terrae]